MLVGVKVLVSVRELIVKVVFDELCRSFFS